MKVRVEPELCIACGACISLVPEVFVWDEEGKAKAVTEDTSGDQEDMVKEAVAACPTEAIKEV